jgi:hypothetical protein
MQDNKLIAEFMGDGKEYEIDINTKTLKSYHTSWDWLMPVVQKCYKIDNEEGFDNLVDAVSTLDLGGTYEAVVWFIQEYNLTPKEVV